MSLTADQAKQIIAANLDRLNSSGRIVASTSDIGIAVRRAQEKKIADQLGALFSSCTMSELNVYLEALDSLLPKPYTAQTSTPVPSQSAPSKPAKRK